MAIVKAPLKTDAAGKCTRWRVILYNKATSKQEWHTIRGTEADAKRFQREQEMRLDRGTYVAKATRKTFGEVAAMFIKEREARNRRAGTLDIYESVLRLHVLPEFGVRGIESIRLTDCEAHFGALRAKGATVATLNRVIRVMKSVLFFAMQRQLCERNPLQRFELFQGGKDERHVRRGAFTETEVQALLGAARPHERPLIGLLVLTGLRPAEAYGLAWEAVDLAAGTLRVERSWDVRSQSFVPPKTAAGVRVVPLAGWLVAELRAHQERTGATGLVFANRTGKPLSPSNLRRDTWIPVLKRAGLPYRDLYSLRSTFATLARASGEAAFNTSRILGHSRSTLVDQVYAKSLPSGLASVASAVASRVFGEQPKLRVIEGGARDVRQPLDEATQEQKKNVGSG